MQGDGEKGFEGDGGKGFQGLEEKIWGGWWVVVLGGLEEWCSGRMEKKDFEGMMEDKDPGGNGSKCGCFEPLLC